MAFTIVVQGAITNNAIAIAGVSVKLRQGTSGSGTLLDQDTTDASGNYSVGTATTGILKVWYDQGGSHEGTYQTEYGGGEDVVETKNWFSTLPSTDPVLGTVSNVSYEEDSGTQTADVTFSDADGDAISNNFTKVSGPSWFTTSVVGGNYRRSFNTNGVSPGGYSASMRANDDWADLGTVKNFTITITEANEAPVLSNPGTKNYDNNSGVQQFQLVATDADSDPITYSKTSGPTWGTVTSGGLVSIDTDAATRGAHNFTWKASDGTDFDTESHTVNINNNVPVLDDPGTLTFVSGSGNQTFQVLYTDEDNDTLTFTKTAGDALASISSSGLITVDTNNLDGSYSISIEGDDGNGGTDTLVIPIELTTPDPAPEVWVIT